VGVSLLYWFIGLLVAGSGLSVYLELASYFPNRSGAEVVYLEQAYPRPKYFFPTAFAVMNVLLAFSSSNAIGMSVSHLIWAALIKIQCCLITCIELQVLHRQNGSQRVLRLRHIQLLLSVSASVLSYRSTLC
jgi:amino acid transporter